MYLAHVIKLFCGQWKGYPDAYILGPIEKGMHMNISSTYESDLCMKV